MIVQDLSSIGVLHVKISPAFARKVSSYQPSKSIVRRAKKTEEHADLLKDRLQTVLRSTYSNRQYASFIDDLDRFLYEAVKNKHLPFDEDFEIKATPALLSAFVKGGPEANNRVNSKDFGLMVYYLDCMGLYHQQHRGAEIEEAFKDSLFHALLNFTSVGEFTLNSVKSRAPGWYRAYRPSSTFPGCYWVGVLEVYNANTGAVCTREYYQSSGFDDRPNKTVSFSGYLLRKGRHHTILTRCEASNSICLALLPSVMMEEKTITAMGGAIMDISTGKLWSGRVFYERIADLPDVQTTEARVDEQDTKFNDQVFEHFKQESRVVTASEMPRSIVHYFLQEEVEGLTLY
jgi:hypothetical protein